MPTFSFIFLCLVLVYPNYIIDNPIILLKFFTLSYNGNPGVDGVGATWYVFTLIQLNLLAPLFSYIAQKAAGSKFRISVLFVFLFALGFIFRFFAVKKQIDWYSMVYTPFFANIDLFFCGICLNQIIKLYANKRFCNVLMKDFSLFVLFVFILVNTIFYGKTFFYQVFCPSIYLLIVGFCLYVFSDEKWILEYNHWLEKLILFFSSISFEFYLFHSLVLHTIFPAFGQHNAVVLYFLLSSVGFILSTICAIGFKRIFELKK